MNRTLFIYYTMTMILMIISGNTIAHIEHVSIRRSTWVVMQEAFDKEAEIKYQLKGRAYTQDEWHEYKSLQKQPNTIINPPAYAVYKIVKYEKNGATSLLGLKTGLATNYMTWPPRYFLQNIVLDKYKNTLYFIEYNNQLAIFTLYSFNTQIKQDDNELNLFDYQKWNGIISHGIFISRMYTEKIHQGCTGEYVPTDLTSFLHGTHLYIRPIIDERSTCHNNYFAYDLDSKIWNIQRFILNSSSDTAGNSIDSNCSVKNINATLNYNDRHAIYIVDREVINNTYRTCNMYPAKLLLDVLQADAKCPKYTQSINELSLLIENKKINSDKKYFNDDAFFNNNDSGSNWLSVGFSMAENGNLKIKNSKVIIGNINTTIDKNKSNSLQTNLLYDYDNDRIVFALVKASLSQINLGIYYFSHSKYIELIQKDLTKIRDIGEFLQIKQHVYKLNNSCEKCKFKEIQITKGSYNKGSYIISIIPEASDCELLMYQISSEKELSKLVSMKINQKITLLKDGEQP